jgi:hypothetical protein
MSRVTSDQVPAIAWIAVGHLSSALGYVHNMVHVTSPTTIQGQKDRQTMEDAKVHIQLAIEFIERFAMKDI